MTPTARQAAILAWLKRINPHARDLFESALWLTEDNPIPRRGQLIGHACREICIVLMNEYSSNSREVTADKLSAFATEFRKLGISFDVPSGSSPEPDTAPTTVSHSFLLAAAEVVTSHGATETARGRTKTMIAGMANQSGGATDVEPTANRWFEMSRFFTKVSHASDTPDSELLDRLPQEVQFFEESMSAFAESAVANLDELDTILEDTNA